MNGIGRWGGWVGLVGVIGFAVIVVTLHLVQPDYDARHQLMSELALGPYGVAMLPAFCLFSLSVLGVQQGLGSVGATCIFRTILVVAASALAGAGIFRLGQATEVHVALIALAFVLIVLGMYLFPSQGGDLGSRISRGVSWFLSAATALAVALGHSILPMGIAQRLAVACVLAWLSFLAWALVRR